MNLTAKKRELKGKAASLRKKGFIPAELYGHGLQNQHLAVSAREFATLFKEAGHSTVVQLEVDSAKHPVVIHDIQKDYLSGEPAHIDFYQVRMDEKMKVKVPIEFTGEAPAVASHAGILNKVMAEIEVEALPADLPHSFTLRLESLAEIGASLHVKDLDIPKGVHVAADPETVIVSVAPPLKEEEPVAAAEVPDVSAVKVETEEKKEERAAAKTAEDNASKT